jgi:hypothetical protein
VPDDTSGERRGTEFSSEEFIAAATQFFETARPWLAAALAEHAAHPEAEPGLCRLCALGGAVSRNVEPFAAEASRSLGQFADEVLADLTKLVEELLGSARTTLAAVAADYLATVHDDTATGAAAEAAPAPTGRPGTPVPTPAPSTPAPSSQATGYERIDVQLPEDPNGKDE